MITLYHAPKSRSSRIIWLLEELKASYEIKLTDIPRMDGSGDADAGNPHPDKKVPALVDDGALITESIAIVQYLTEKFPAAGLAPTVGHAARGPFLTWLAYYAGVIEPVVMLAFAGLADHPFMHHSLRGRSEIDRRILTALSAQPFLIGPQFSAVDLLIASLGHWSRDMLPQGELVDSYLRRCNDRPALARAMARDQG